MTKGLMPSGSDSETNPSSDLTSSFYIYTNDYLQRIHINDCLTDNSYVNWPSDMKDFLLAKNRASFNDGTKNH